MHNYIKQPEGGLLQSSQWMDVLRAENKRIIQMQNGKDVLYGIEQKLPFVGKYLYFPRVQGIAEKTIEEMCALQYGWIRIDVNNDEMMCMLQKTQKKIVEAPHDMQPQENFIIDITKSEEVLLQEMKSKTRYNIRLAQKKGVEIFTSKEQKYIDKFYDLVTMTADRKAVSFHQKDHYEKILTFLSDETVTLYIARYQDEIVAINIISFFNDTATYLHGATSDHHRSAMAPFLLQWQAMRDARKRDCMWYDLGGIFTESGDSGKQGITRFKEGFAPGESIYNTKGSYDILLSPLRYKLYRILQKLR